jgi:hypothetical protein
MNAFKRVLGLAFVCVGLFSGCNHQKEVGVTAYVNHLDAHWAELSDSRTLNKVEYQVRFLPNDYRIIDRFGESLDGEKLQVERENLSEFQYFQVRLKAGGANIMDYQLNPGETPDSRLNYFTHNMARDLALIDGSDTLACEAHQFVTNHGISPWVSVLAAFKATKNENTKRLVIHDEIFHNGKVILKIPASAISEIPQLTLDKS